MEPTRIDQITKAFARRRLSRRETLATGAAGLAAGVFAAGFPRHSAAQDASPAAAEQASPESSFDPNQKIEFLFLQTYQSGTITPVEGVDGLYTVTLEAGSGQTVYFSDRPERIVGADPTPQFLEGLGFQPGNPPNAALVVETAPGETDIAVVELFNPLYDPVSQGVTYEVEVLANWQDSLEMGFSEAPTDLAALAPSFGSAHLFIDDCADSNLSCCYNLCDFENNCQCLNIVHDFGTVNYCYQWGRCVPCIPYYHNASSFSATWDYWDFYCNKTFDACDNICASGYWVS